MDSKNYNIDNRHVINPHVNNVNGVSQTEINAQLGSKFITLNPDHPLYEKLKNQVEELNKGILVINKDSKDPSIFIKDTQGNIVKISGNGSITVETYENALKEATSNNIGQVIYVKNDSLYEDEEYDAGPYMSVGDNTLIKLASSTASGDVVNDISKLQTKVSGLETAVGKDGEEPSGLYKKITDAETIVKEYADGLNTAMNTRVEALEAIDHDHENKTVLDGITAEKVEAWDKAQVNVIEKIIINGQEVTIDDDKTATIDIVQEILSGDGILVEDNVINIKLKENETNLFIDEDGYLTLSAINNVITVNNVDEFNAEIGKEIIKEGQLIFLKEGDDNRINGLYYITNEKKPCRILFDDGSKDVIEFILNKITNIEGYTINNKSINTDGGVILSGEDILVNNITLKPEMDVINTNVENKPTIDKSIEILQNNIAALTTVISVSLNEFAVKIQELEKLIKGE
jgi:hypothetical protein